ncbi:MAG TPA: O-antigen ligase family protein [Gammaproteobacteria bacterium]|jgi:O-antigen ligase|nr:O-antigen ligase family protein [Gammaproteobacteria bacterium]
MMQELRESWQALKAWMAGPAGERRADRYLRISVAAVVVLFPALCLLVSRSDSYSLLVLTIVGLIAWWRNGFKSGFSRRDWMFVAVFLVFLAAGLLAFELGHQSDNGFRLLGRYLRLVLVLPILAAFKRYRPAPALVWAGLGLGSLVLGVDAVWERVSIAGFLQPDGDTNVAILFGDLATLTTFAFAAGYVYVDAELPRLGPRLMQVGILAGLVACILSGARGAWIALPVLLVLFLSCRHLLRPRGVLAGAVAILVLFGGLYLLPQTRVRERILNPVRQLQLYDYVRQSLRDEPAPVCLDDPRLLEAWAATRFGSSSQNLSIDIQPAQAPWAAGLQQFGCRRSLVMHFSNLKGVGASVDLPRTPWHGQRPAVARFIMAGNATVRFGGKSHSALRSHGPVFDEVRMSAPLSQSDYLRVSIPPHGNFYLVPVEQYPGEYRYTLLHSSLGDRLQMWGVAWDMFKTAPVTGIGTAAYMDRAQRMVDAGEASPVTAEYDHPHNEFLDALATRGVVGLLALLALLGVPGWLFARGLDSPDPVRLGASLAGLLVSVAFAMFGLSETMLVHSIALGWYAIMTALFLVTSEGPQGRGA